jgi:hypothetical protein
MCGHKVKLPGLHYKKNNYSGHRVSFFVLNNLKKHKQLNSFFNNLWVALKRATHLDDLDDCLDD